MSSEADPLTTFTPGIEARRNALRKGVPTWTATTLHGRLDQSAAQFGNPPLVICDESTLTYDDVVDESDSLAAGLTALGGACAAPRRGT